MFETTSINQLLTPTASDETSEIEPQQLSLTSEKRWDTADPQSLFFRKMKPNNQLQTSTEHETAALLTSAFDAATGRRGFLRGAGLSAITLTTTGTIPLTSLAQAQTTSSTQPTGNFKPYLDNKVTIDRARLDGLAATVHDAFNEHRILRKFDAKLHGAKFDVELHRITTYTRPPGTGETLKVSGLLAIPVGVKGALPVVSWQHGTILAFDQVPSNLTLIADPAYVLRDNVDSMETLLNVQRLAGNGYAVIAADYVGKGPYRNGRAEAYAVKDVTVRTCLDILDAGLTGMRALGHPIGSLLLNGWSQGALNTQWLHQELRRQGRPIKATAVQSPFNDLNEAFRFWAGADVYADSASAPYPRLADWISLCMVVVLGSYERQYGLDGLLRTAIRSEYHDLALKFWSDYQMDFNPKKPFPSGSKLLVDGFFERYTADLNSRFLRQLAANRNTYWPYDSPIRFYYGLADEAIHPTLAKRPLAAGGKYASGVPIKGASHRGTFLASLYAEGEDIAGSSNVLRWFDSITKS